MFSDPKVTSANYISYFVSPYHVWFRDLGYAELDICRFEDGEWSIIQFFRSPVVPAQTPWNHVLTKLRHVEISPWVCKHFAESLDLERREIWDRVAAGEQAAALDKRREDAHCEDISQRMTTAITGNDALMNRIARNGLSEMRLSKLFRHVPTQHFKRKRTNATTVFYSSKPASEDLSPGVAGTP